MLSWVAQPRTGMNNPRGRTLSQRTGYPDDAPWSMNNSGLSLSASGPPNLVLAIMRFA